MRRNKNSLSAKHLSMRRKLPATVFAVLRNEQRKLPAMVFAVLLSVGLGLGGTACSGSGRTSGVEYIFPEDSSAGTADTAYLAGESDAAGESDSAGESNPAGESDPAEQETITILMTHSEEKNSLTQMTAEYLSERLEEISGGKMKISVYGNNTLGDLSEATTSITNGTVQMRIGTIGCEAINILRWLPTLSDADIDDIENALEPGTALRNIIDEELDEKNVLLMGTLPVNYRVLTSNIPLNSVKDFEKLKIRTIFAGMEEQYWNALGAETLNFSVEKVYLALQMGYVNAQENTVPSIVSNRLYELQKYVTALRHRVYMDQIFINEDFYDSLTDEQRGWLDTAVSDALDYGSRKMSSYITSGLNQLAEEDVEVSDFPEEERQKMIAIVRPVLYQQLCDENSEELVNQVIAAVY